MPWLLELDGRPGLKSGPVSRQVRAQVPGLVPTDCPRDEDVVGVIACAGPSRELSETLGWAARLGVDVLVLTTAGSGLDPWITLSAGAADVLVWDDDPRPVRAAVERRLEVQQLAASPQVARTMLGESPALRRAVRELVTAARFGRGPLLLLGETGTGKELAARAVHAVRVAAGAASGRLVVVDCTTIVPSLSGSELFGHERGAFTGAVSVRTGAFAAADGGTMLLDEVGDLPLDLQPELLRVVQEGTYKPVGSDSWRRSRFWLVCATHRDLAADVAEGRFRADLYYRIAATTVVLPPLRERRVDIVPLFRHFVAAAWANEERRPDAAGVTVTAEVADVLERRAYPGNLRDLQQLAQRVAARHVGPGPITPGDLPDADRPLPVGLGPVAGFVPRKGAMTACSGRCRADGGGPTPPDLSVAVRAALRTGTSLKLLREQVANLAVDMALEESGGSVRVAAAQLGVTQRALHLRRAQRRG
jgi:transcriptional regulator with GAF, ATPase, and Fis domain